MEVHARDKLLTVLLRGCLRIVLFILHEQIKAKQPRQPQMTSRLSSLFAYLQIYQVLLALPPKYILIFIFLYPCDYHNNSKRSHILLDCSGFLMGCKASHAHTGQVSIHSSRQIRVPWFILQALMLSQGTRYESIPGREAGPIAWQAGRLNRQARSQ